MIKLLFTGDFCPTGIDFRRFRIDPELQKLLGEADAVIGNLECPVTVRAAPRPGQYINLKAAPEINPLTARFTAFSLANNHILDFGAEGASDTIDFLDRQDIASFGFGRNSSEAAQPCRLNLGGRTIALFGATQWYPGSRTRPGTCSDKNSSLFRNIRNCRELRHFIVVFPHWNYEFSPVPSPASRRLAERLIESGVDLIVGSHPHLVNGIELIHGKTVAYSLGNFLMPPWTISLNQVDKPGLWKSIILECTLDHARSGYSISIHPVRFSGDSIELLRGPDRMQTLSEIDSLNTHFRSSRALRKAFYSHSQIIINRVSSNLAAMHQAQGFRAIAGRRHRVRLQDGLIWLHSLGQRIK